MLFRMVGRIFGLADDLRVIFLTNASGLVPGGTGGRDAGAGRHR
jgi:hypothetical protein